MSTSNNCENNNNNPYTNLQGNIEIRDSWRDGPHLLESGKTKLAENFIYFLSSCYRLSPCDNFLIAFSHTHPHAHTLAHEHIYTQMHTLNYQMQKIVNQSQLKTF